MELATLRRPRLRRLPAVRLPATLDRIARSPAWAALALVLLAAHFRLGGLAASREDYFYDAAVRSMSLSWHNFFYGAFDPSGRLAVDKPPVDLWLQVASVKLFGFSARSLVLPAAVAGTLAVPLLYDAVRRLFGSLAGICAGVALAVLPVSVVASRSDALDALMMALTVLALWLVVLAVQRGRVRYLYLAGAGDGPRLQREAVRGARCAARPVPALHARLAHPVAPAERARGRGGCAVRARGAVLGDRGVAQSIPFAPVPDRVEQRERVERALRLQRAPSTEPARASGGRTQPRRAVRGAGPAAPARRAARRVDRRRAGGCRGTRPAGADHGRQTSRLGAAARRRRRDRRLAGARHPALQSHDQPARALPRSVHAGGGHRPRDRSGPAGRSRCARASDGRRGARGGARGGSGGVACTHHAPGARARLPGPGRGRRGGPARPGGRPGGTVRALGQAPGEPRGSAGRRPGAGLRAGQPGEHLRAPRPPARLRLRHRARRCPHTRSPSSTASCWPTAARPSTSSAPRLRRRRRR